jgi:DNA-binding FrmR family transcriptional regulator
MDKDYKKTLVKRLSIARGHLEKVRKMVEDDAYCPDVIHQSQAVQAALKKVDEKILHKHLNTCVLGDMGDKKKSKKLAQEIEDLFKKNS